MRVEGTEVYERVDSILECFATSRILLRTLKKFRSRQRNEKIAEQFSAAKSNGFQRVAINWYASHVAPSSPFQSKDACFPSCKADISAAAAASAAARAHRS